MQEGICGNTHKGLRMCKETKYKYHFTQAQRKEAQSPEESWSKQVKNKLITEANHLNSTTNPMGQVTMLIGGDPPKMGAFGPSQGAATPQASTIGLSIEYRRQSSKGYPMKVDWSVAMRVIENKKTTETQELDRFGLSARCNTLLLWSVGLYWLLYDVACDPMP